MPIRSEIAIKPIAWLTQNFEDKKLKTEISIQRREVWNLDTKSNLIVSILVDVPIESLLFEEIEGTDEFMVIDGKQRTLTVCGFLRGDFKLSKNVRLPFIDGVDIRGLSYDELPEKLKRIITNRNFAVTIMRPLTDAERPLVFYMRNQAVTLTNMEISRASVGEPGMSQLTELIGHPFMGKVKITLPARRKYQDMQMFIEYLMLKALGENTGFTALELSSFCDHLHDNPEIIDMKNMSDILNYLDRCYDKKRAYLKKANLPMVLLVAEQAMTKIDPEAFSEWSDALFDELKDNETYVKSCKSYKKTDVQERLNIIMSSAQTKLLKKKK